MNDTCANRAIGQEAGLSRNTISNDHDLCATCDFSSQFLQTPHQACDTNWPPCLQALEGFGRDRYRLR